MRLLKTVAMLAAAGMIAACANFAAVTYNSVPVGAVISYKDGGGSLGIAPIRQEYELKGDCLRIQGVTATWVSGARAYTDDALVLCGGPGSEFGVTFTRPASYPGYDLDQSSAIEFGSLQSSGTYWQESALQMFQSVQASQPRNADGGPRSICRSEQVGNQVYTRCD